MRCSRQLQFARALRIEDHGGEPAREIEIEAFGNKNHLAATREDNRTLGSCVDLFFGPVA